MHYKAFHQLFPEKLITKLLNLPTVAMNLVFHNSFEYIPYIKIRKQSSINECKKGFITKVENERENK